MLRGTIRERPLLQKVHYEETLDFVTIKINENLNVVNVTEAETLINLK